MAEPGSFQIARSVAGSELHGDPRKAGILERAVTRFFMRPAVVVATSDLSSAFRLIDFQNESLKSCSWSPGDKVQVKLDGGFITRTYTPISWDTAQGATQFLAYCHGTGPGSEWAKQVQTGDERQFFGPRSSISLDGLTSCTILFGDETSFALALALERSAALTIERRYVFEVNDRMEASDVLQRLDLPNATLVEREVGDAHLAEIGAAVLNHLRPDATYILSGKASSIQYVSRSLKAAGVSTRSLRSKAYWAPGKEGMD